MLPIRGAKATEDGTGVIIDPLSGGVNLALQSAAVWACCRLLSCAISALPAHVFQETAEGKVKAVNHPYYRLLGRQPNPEMTWPQYLQTTILHLLLYGNAFTWIDWLGEEVIAIWPLVPERMAITFAPDGTAVYRYMDASGASHEYFSPDLIHFRIFSLDGFIGLAPLDYHRLTFDFENSASNFAVSLYKSGGRPSGVLSFPGELRQQQVDQIRSSWQSIHNTPGRVGLVWGGATYTPVSVPMQQLEYIASQKFTVEQIARIFGLAPHLIGAGDHPTYASVEQQSLETSQYTMQPIVISLERSIESALLDPPFIFKINLNGFERSDIKSRYAAYAQGRQWGWLSVNDIRELEDVNRVESGDIYLQPMNMVEAGVPPPPAQAPPPPPAQIGVSNDGLRGEDLPADPAGEV